MPSLTLAEWRDIAAMSVTLIGVATFIKAVIEYTQQGAQKRVDRFLELRQRFKRSDSFAQICDWLESDDLRLEQVSYTQKRDFLGFYEEVALLTNSRLLRPAVAHYMFGYYALRCWESDRFWIGLERRSQYWSLFADFARRMGQHEDEFSYSRRRLRL